MVFMFAADRKRVMMTGFGPFQNDEINPSWEAVKLMDGREIENKYDITFFRKEITVNYDEVDTLVPQMWEFYQPHLTIHVGLNKEVKKFVLEKKAHVTKYCIPDEDEQLPKDNRNARDGPDVISTTLDVEKICKKFNHCKRKLRDPTLGAKWSEDAGMYLCEYIYYTSLCIGRSIGSRTLFVHVPFDKYTPEQLKYGLERILELCLKQLSTDDDYYSYEVDTKLIN